MVAHEYRAPEAPPTPAHPHLTGKVAALEILSDDDRYFMDVVDLALVIQRALRSLDGVVIEGHLRAHVAEQMTNGETERAVTELLRLYKVQGPAETQTTKH